MEEKENITRSKWAKTTNIWEFWPDSEDFDENRIFYIGPFAEPFNTLYYELIKPTVESFGVRCKVDAEGYDGTISQGSLLVVSTADGSEGKLVDVNETAETGDYEQVARAEEVNDTDGWIIFRTISPVMVTLS